MIINRERFHMFCLVLLLLVVGFMPNETYGQSTVLNGKIAFASSRDGDYEIYTMNPEGTAIIQLTDNDFTDTEPSWSPDGTRLAFVSNRDEPDHKYEIYVMDMDGSNPTRLTDLKSRTYFPTWSPDGNQIAFSVEESGDQTSGTNIYTMNSDGSNQKRITLAQLYDEYFVSSWSPDGERLAFATDFPFESDMKIYGTNYTHYSIKPDGTDMQPLGYSAGKEFRVPRPQYSPDGSHYVYHQNNSTVYISNLDGTDIEFPDNGFYPAWSPDGTKIVFTRKRLLDDGVYDDNTDIYVMNPDGTNRVQLTDTPGFDNQYPTWQPLFPPTAAAGDDQLVTDSDGNGSEFVTLDGSDSSASNGMIVSYSWQEDGTEIAAGVNPMVDLAVGTHVITLVVTDDDGLTASDEVVITVNVPPVANAGSDQSVTDEDNSGSEAVMLDASGSSDSDGTLVSYSWQEEDTEIAIEVNPMIDLTVGTHVITLIVTDDGGAIATDEVIITVLAGSSSLSPFVVLSEEGVFLGLNSVVVSGDVGANVASPGPFLNYSAEIIVGAGVDFLDPESQIMGDTVWLGSRSQVYNVYYNDLRSSPSSHILGTQVTPLDLPLVDTFPALPEFTPSQDNITVPTNNSLTLDAGNYGRLRVRTNATLILTGGVYHFEEWDVRTNAQIYVTAPTEIRVADKLQVDTHSYVGPAPEATHLDASDLMIYVNGQNGNTGNLLAIPKAAKFGINSTLIANVYVPNGTLYLGHNTQARGAFLGRWVDVGLGAEITLESGF